MVRVLLVLVFSTLPAIALAGEGQKLAALEATLVTHYGKLLEEARAEDAGVRQDNLPESYADHEKILKNSQAVFEDFMVKACAQGAGDAQAMCKINLITNRLAMLGYGDQE